MPTGQRQALPDHGQGFGQRVHDEVGALPVERPARVVVQVHGQRPGPLARLDVEGVVAHHQQLAHIHPQLLGGVEHAVGEAAWG